MRREEIFVQREKCKRRSFLKEDVDKASYSRVERGKQSIWERSGAEILRAGRRGHIWDESTTKSYIRRRRFRAGGLGSPEVVPDRGGGCHMGTEADSLRRFCLCKESIASLKVLRIDNTHVWLLRRFFIL